MTATATTMKIIVPAHTEIVHRTTGYIISLIKHSVPQRLTTSWHGQDLLLLLWN